MENHQCALGIETKAISLRMKVKTIRGDRLMLLTLSRSSFCWRPSERYQTWKDCNRYTALRRVVLFACQWSANAITFAVERVVSRALRRRLQSDLRFGSLPHLASHTPLQQGICTRLGWAACKSERLVSGSHSPGLFTDANFRLHSPLGADQFRRAECVS